MSVDNYSAYLNQLTFLKIGDRVIRVISIDIRSVSKKFKMSNIH